MIILIFLSFIVNAKHRKIKRTKTSNSIKKFNVHIYGHKNEPRRTTKVIKRSNEIKLPFTFFDGEENNVNFNTANDEDNDIMDVINPYDNNIWGEKSAIPIIKGNGIKIIHGFFHKVNNSVFDNNHDYLNLKGAHEGSVFNTSLDIRPKRIEVVNASKRGSGIKVIHSLKGGVDININKDDKVSRNLKSVDENAWDKHARLSLKGDSFPDNVHEDIQELEDTNDNVLKVIHDLKMDDERQSIPNGNSDEEHKASERKKFIHSLIDVPSLKTAVRNKVIPYLKAAVEDKIIPNIKELKAAYVNRISSNLKVPDEDPMGTLKPGDELQGITNPINANENENPGDEPNINPNLKNGNESETIQELKSRDKGKESVLENDLANDMVPPDVDVNVMQNKQPAEGKVYDHLQPLIDNVDAKSSEDELAYPDLERADESNEKKSPVVKEANEENDVVANFKSTDDNNITDIKYSNESPYNNVTKSTTNENETAHEKKLANKILHDIKHIQEKISYHQSTKPSDENQVVQTVKGHGESKATSNDNNGKRGKI